MRKKSGDNNIFVLLSSAPPTFKLNEWRTTKLKGRYYFQMTNFSKFEYTASDNDFE